MTTKKTYVDITGWIEKIGKVRNAELMAVKALVDWGLQDLFTEARNNLSGPRYGIVKGRPIRGPMTNAGILPVPVVTGTLRQSIKIWRFNPALGAVWSDPKIANYTKLIHDGGWSYYFGKRFFMKPRPFMRDAARKTKFKFEAKKSLLLAKIRAEGRKLG